MNTEQVGKWLIILGVFAVAIGLLIYFFGSRFSWFGNLPGDIKIEKEGFKFYAPVTSMIILSAVISLLLWLIRKL